MVEVEQILDQMELLEPLNQMEYLDQLEEVAEGRF